MGWVFNKTFSSLWSFAYLSFLLYLFFHSLWLLVHEVLEFFKMVELEINTTVSSIDLISNYQLCTIETVQKEYIQKRKYAVDNSTVHINGHVIMDLKRKNKRLRSWIIASSYPRVILVGSDKKFARLKLFLKRRPKWCFSIFGDRYHAKYHVLVWNTDASTHDIDRREKTS